MAHEVARIYRFIMLPLKKMMANVLVRYRLCTYLPPVLTNTQKGLHVTAGSRHDGDIPVARNLRLSNTPFRFMPPVLPAWILQLAPPFTVPLLLTMLDYSLLGRASRCLH